MILYDKIDFRTLDFEFKGRSYKKELLNEMKNLINKINSSTKNKHEITSEDFVGVATGYNLILTDENCGGYCDRDNMEIATNENNIDSKNIIIHECCHVLQYNVGLIDNCDRVLLSDNLKFEQQCETMAYLINLKLFNSDRPQDYTSYFSKEDAEYLMYWYGGWIQNDLIL